MCVIAYKAKNVRFPSENNIRKMWDRNPDGAGVMWRENDGSVSFVKGFMKLKNLEKWIKDNRAWLEEVECALHFRITTHGGTSAGNCHPFVCAEDADPHLLKGKAKRVLMHNGILPFAPRKKDISDSAELALRLGGVSDPAKTMESVDECLRGNRIILMDENGTHFYGDRFKPYDDTNNKGILYSNLNWYDSGFISYGGSGKTHSIPYGTYYDEKTDCFRERFTGNVVSFHDVDPCDLSDDDYVIWEEICECDWSFTDDSEKYGMTPSEYRDLVCEAESYGMSVEDYMEYCYDDSRCCAG